MVCEGLAPQGWRSCPAVGGVWRDRSALFVMLLNSEGTLHSHEVFPLNSIPHGAAWLWCGNVGRRGGSATHTLPAPLEQQGERNCKPCTDGRQAGSAACTHAHEHASLWQGGRKDTHSCSPLTNPYTLPVITPPPPCSPAAPLTQPPPPTPAQWPGGQAPQEQPLMQQQQLLQQQRAQALLLVLLMLLMALLLISLLLPAQSPSLPLRQQPH